MAAPHCEREVCVGRLEVDALDEMAAADVLTRGHSALEHVRVQALDLQTRAVCEVRPEIAEQHDDHADLER